MRPGWIRLRTDSAAVAVNPVWQWPGSPGSPQRAKDRSPVADPSKCEGPGRRITEPQIDGALLQV